MTKNGYLNVDVDQACHPNWIIPAGDLSSLPKSHFDEVLAKDVLEHFPRAKSLEVLLDLASLIKVGGSIIVQTTSIAKVDQKFIDNPLLKTSLAGQSVYLEIKHILEIFITQVLQIQRSRFIWLPRDLKLLINP
jgi:2-polyprenyl-3-methyl-5-hydroxy-6-metoxy-1,4-benzoquinol methylase